MLHVTPAVSRVTDYQKASKDAAEKEAATAQALTLYHQQEIKAARLKSEEQAKQMSMLETININQELELRERRQVDETIQEIKVCVITPHTKHPLVCCK